jgi:hypothetical protein
MQKAAGKWLMVASVIISLNAAGWAEDDAVKAEYLSNCATCHGIDGKGKGPRSSKLRSKPAADLTLLSKRNNGVFPLSAVYESIDGRNMTGSHGIREMPIWGCRHTPSPLSPPRTAKRKVYKLETYESHLDLSCDPEDVIANRILSVVEYLRRIQEK